MHQQRLATRRNLPDEYDFTALNTDTIHDEIIPCNFNGRYSFFDIINYWIRSKPLDPIKVMKEMALHRGE